MEAAVVSKRRCEDATDAGALAEAILAAAQRHATDARISTCAVQGIRQSTAIPEREARIGERLAKAAELEDLHQPTDAGWCLCHRPWPCSVVVTAREIREQALIDLRDLHELPDTVVLPKVRVEDGPPAGSEAQRGERPRAVTRLLFLARGSRRRRRTKVRTRYQSGAEGSDHR
jgi:hypothetical protein